MTKLAYWAGRAKAVHLFSHFFNKYFPELLKSIRPYSLESNINRPGNKDIKSTITNVLSAMKRKHTRKAGRLSHVRSGEGEPLSRDDADNRTVSLRSWGSRGACFPSRSNRMCKNQRRQKKKKKMKCIWWNDGSVYEYKGGVEWYECKAGDLRLCHKVMRKLLNIIEQGSETNLQKQFWI